MTDETSIEHRLTRLFATAELGAVARSDATPFLVARVARRRARRRVTRTATVLGGVLGVAVLAGTLAGMRAGRPFPGPPSDTVVLSPAAAPELAMRAGAVGALRLGMTAAQAKATGLLRDEEPLEVASRPGCRSFQGLHGITTVMIGPRGVEYVEVYPFIATAEGVAVGDRIADARRAYPTLSVPDDWQLGTVVSVPVPGVSGAHYTITMDVKGDAAGSDPDDALVSRLALVSDTAGCSRS